MADKNAKKEKTSDAEVRDAISAFEQILEAIPNDRLALETLSDAYIEVGDKPKALEYLTRLAAAVADDGDAAAAPGIIRKLQDVGAKNPAAQEVLKRLERLVAPKKGASVATAAKAETSKKKGVDITTELALAWNLVQAGELTQEDYSNVVHDLTESSTKNVEVPITVLHVLHDRGFKGLEKVLNFLSSDSGLPIIALASFEPQKDAYSLLPLEFMAKRGALVFELMRQDALVAILNPYDTELRDEVKKLTNRNCHFYLVPADSYDAYLDFIKKALADAAAKAAKQ